MATGNTNAIPTYGEVGLMLAQPKRDIATLSATTKNISTNFGNLNSRTYGIHCISLYTSIETNQDVYSDMYIHTFSFMGSVCFISFVVCGRYTNNINFPFDRNDTEVQQLIEYLMSRTPNQSENFIFSGDNVSFNMVVDKPNGVLKVTITGSSPADYCQYNFLMTPTTTYLGKSYYEW